MGKIVLLDDLTINQIAAGEVIERPASVVKELVENSIDAGAKNITIDVKNGGISYIRVIDDGSGIMPDDMEIAFERHATSKIRQAKDLEVVKSMGFRGEALASIAAIAKIELVSKTADEEMGYKVVFEGGDLIDKHEEGTSKGTSITVTDLFYNTPVRYKFLRKDFTELGYIEDAVTRIALANPNVAIKLISSGKTSIQTNGSGKLEDCIYAIYGKEIMENILPVDYTYDDMHITGAIGKPIISRSNRTNQLFFINHRYVKDKTLTSAAEQGFKGLVTVGKHGFLILNIDMDAKKVDVNVHPTKLEIRFQDESNVFKAVYHAIKETLLKGDLVSDTEKDYSDFTPNDMLKEIKNKDRIEAWGLNKSFAISKYEKGTEIKKEKADESKAESESKDENVDNGPKFSAFKDTIKALDEETRTKFVKEIAKARTAEEISDGLNKFTAFLNNSKETEKIDYDSNKENSTEMETIDNKENNTEIEKNVDKENLIEENLEKDSSVKENKDSNDKKLIEDLTEKIEVEELIKEQEQLEENENNDTLNTEKNIDKDNIDEEEKTEMSFEEMYKKLFGRDIEDAKKEHEEEIREEEKKYPISPITDNEISIFDKEGEKSKLPYKFIGIAFNTYIILSINDDLYILDQHAAHERIMYEKVKKNYFSDDNKDSQMMLLPDIINLNTKEMGIFKDNRRLFEKAGFMVEEFGEGTIKLVGVPEFCMNFDTKEIFLETLDEINTVARTAKQELEDKFLATVACKAAVKANMALTHEEVDSLMQELLKLPNPFSCPHGRPTVIKMSKTDIEKKFSRR